MHIFRVSFLNNGKVYQLHAQQVAQGDLYGFVSISDLLFDEHTAIVIDPAAGKSLQLSVASFMVGAIPEVQYETDTYEVPPGARLYLFSDGVFEIGRDDFTLDSLADLFLEVSTSPKSRLEQVRKQIEDLQGSDEFGDDFTLLEIEFP